MDDLQGKTLLKWMIWGGFTTPIFGSTPMLDDRNALHQQRKNPSHSMSPSMPTRVSRTSVGQWGNP